MQVSKYSQNLFHALLTISITVEKMPICFQHVTEVMKLIHYFLTNNILLPVSSSTL